VSTPDRDATRGLVLSVVGLLLAPALLVLLAALPPGTRKAAYLASLGVIAAVSLTGGVIARRALGAGTTKMGRAVAGAMLGLTVGVTASVLGFWTLIGVVL